MVHLPHTTSSPYPPSGAERVLSPRLLRDLWRDRLSPVPEVRVGPTGLTFDFVFLGALLGFSSITMPDFRAVLVGEDLSSASA